MSTEPSTPAPNEPPVDRLAAVTAQARRLYLHLLNGGTLKPDDLSRVVASLERLVRPDEPPTFRGPYEAASLDDLRDETKKFVRWVAVNDFTDPDCMLVCAEWHNLCAAVGEPMRMAGSLYRERNG